MMKLENLKDVSKKTFDEYSKIRVKCQCGHTVMIPVYLDKKQCNWCKRPVHNNTKYYFRYKLRKTMNETTNKKG